LDLYVVVSSVDPALVDFTFHDSVTSGHGHSLPLSISKGVDDLCLCDTGYGSVKTCFHTPELIQGTWSIVTESYVTGLNVTLPCWTESSILQNQQRILRRIDR
jgi:hypothetical protein